MAKARFVKVNIPVHNHLGLVISEYAEDDEHPLIPAIVKDDKQNIIQLGEQLRQSKYNNYGVKVYSTRNGYRNSECHYISYLNFALYMGCYNALEGLLEISQDFDITQSDGYFYDSPLAILFRQRQFFNKNNFPKIVLLLLSKHLNVNLKVINKVSNNDKETYPVLNFIRSIMQDKPELRAAKIYLYLQNQGNGEKDSALARVFFDKFKDSAELTLAIIFNIHLQEGGLSPHVKSQLHHFCRESASSQQSKTRGHELLVKGFSEWLGTDSVPGNPRKATKTFEAADEFLLNDAILFTGVKVRHIRELMLAYFYRVYPELEKSWDDIRQVHLHLAHSYGDLDLAIKLCILTELKQLTEKFHLDAIRLALVYFREEIQFLQQGENQDFIEQFFDLVLNSETLKNPEILAELLKSMQPLAQKGFIDLYFQKLELLGKAKLNDIHLLTIKKETVESLWRFQKHDEIHDEDIECSIATYKQVIERNQGDKNLLKKMTAQLATRRASEQGYEDAFENGNAKMLYPLAQQALQQNPKDGVRQALEYYSRVFDKLFSNKDFAGLRELMSLLSDLNRDFVLSKNEQAERNKLIEQYNSDEVFYALLEIKLKAEIVDTQFLDYAKGRLFKSIQLSYESTSLDDWEEEHGINVSAQSRNFGKYLEQVNYLSDIAAWSKMPEKEQLKQIKKYIHMNYLPALYLYWKKMSAGFFKDHEQLLLIATIANIITINFDQAAQEQRLDLSWMSKISEMRAYIDNRQKHPSTINIAKALANLIDTQLQLQCSSPEKANIQNPTQFVWDNVEKAQPIIEKFYGVNYATTSVTDDYTASAIGTSSSAAASAGPSPQSFFGNSASASAASAASAPSAPSADSPSVISAYHPAYNPDAAQVEGAPHLDQQASAGDEGQPDNKPTIAVLRF